MMTPNTRAMDTGILPLAPPSMKSLKEEGNIMSLETAARKKAKQTMSPDRDYGFSNLNVQEQEEKPSPVLRQAAKSAPQNIESSSSETEPKRKQSMHVGERQG
jgi:hypothetical protein